jgi:ethanolamine utilization protein EutP
MRRALVIGKTGAGKTSLSQALSGRKLEYKKTQTVEIIGDIIDTPGEYLERKPFFKALTVTAMDCDCVAILLDVTDAQISIPPLIAAIFGREVIGVVTKIDLAGNEKQLHDAGDNLRMAGCSNIFYVSSKTGQGVAELRTYLQ